MTKTKREKKSWSLLGHHQSFFFSRGLPKEDLGSGVAHTITEAKEESKSKHTAEYINTRTSMVKHQEGGVLVLSPEPNPIMVATILMQMTTASQYASRRVASRKTHTTHRA